MSVAMFVTLIGVHVTPRSEAEDIYDDASVQRLVEEKR